MNRALVQLGRMEAIPQNRLRSTQITEHATESKHTHESCQDCDVRSLISCIQVCTSRNTCHRNTCHRNRNAESTCSYQRGQREGPPCSRANVLPAARRSLPAPRTSAPATQAARRTRAGEQNRKALQVKYVLACADQPVKLARCRKGSTGEMGNRG